MEGAVRYRIAVLASGNGTNAEQIIRRFQHHPDIRVEVLMSNRSDAYALIRARNLGIKAETFTREEWNDGRLSDRLDACRVTHIVLAGFLWLVPAHLISRFPNRIINIHPSLLPAFGGKGMYGGKVHEAVKAAGVEETGITIHLVNEHYDEGKIRFQARCPVLASDSPDDIAERVHQLEYRHYPEQVERWIQEDRIHR